MGIDHPDFRGNTSVLLQSLLTLLFWVPAWRFYNGVLERFVENVCDRLFVDLVCILFGASLVLFLFSYV